MDGQGDARFLKLASHLPDYVALIDRERRFCWANRLAPGLVWDQVEGTPVEQWMTEASKPRAIEAIERCFETGSHTEYAVEAYGDGTLIASYENRVVPSPAEDGTPYALILTRDVTEQILSARRLQTSEQRLSRAMSSGRIALWEHEPDTGRTYRDERLVEWSGLDPNDQGIEEWREIIHPDDRSRAEAWFASLYEGQTEAAELEYRLRTSDGSYRTIIDRGARQILDDGRVLLTGAVLDVTEQRRLEHEAAELARQLEQTQRLESIGLLAGGVAHEINNLLMVINCSVELANMALTRAKPLDPHLTRIKETAHRAASLTGQLLAFGRRSRLEIHPVELREVVDHVHDLVTRVLPKTIDIELELSDQDMVVDGDRHQLEQVLLNLCINARDAMPEGGQLRVRLRPIDDRLELEVSDTGEGIRPEHLDHVFEPFFTTKAVGEGTGLGLSMVHGIIKQHGGSIEVTSELGVGTQFRIRLPASSSSVEHEAAVEPRGARKAARLLVAEDEPTVLEVLAQVLAHAGYDIVTACDGQDALDKWEAHGGRFDLVLLDARMPVLDGRQTFERLRKAGAKVPVLFSSGYSMASLSNLLAGHAQTRLLSKPYDTRALLQTIEEMLASS